MTPGNTSSRCLKEARDDIARDMSLKQQFLSLGALVGIPLFNLRLLLDKRIWKKQIPFWVFGKLIQSLAESTSWEP